MTTVSLRDELGGTATSLRDVATTLGMGRQVSLRDLIGVHSSPVEFSESITIDDPLGGRHSIKIMRNGGFRYRGHLRATGWPSFDTSLIATLGFALSAGGVSSSMQLGFNERGRTHGTNEPGSRTISWDRSGSDETITNLWPAFRQATLRHTLRYKANYFGAFGDIASRVAAVVAMGTFFGPTGAAIALSGNAAEIADLNELIVPGLVGVVLSAGAAFLLTPGLMIPVFLIGAAATPGLIKQRKLSAAERAFADQVFDGTVPYDRILLSNLAGLGNRGFTAPGPGSVIFINMGKGYNNPTTWASNAAGDKQRAPGHLFIHELTHAWQIARDSFTPLLYCESLADQVWAQVDRPSVYRYGVADKPWGEFSTEQQASIVADWCAGNLDPPREGFRPQRAFPPMDQTLNPYWRYLRDNVRAGLA